MNRTFLNACCGLRVTIYLVGIAAITLAAATGGIIAA